MQAPIAIGHAMVIQVMPDFPQERRARQTASLYRLNFPPGWRARPLITYPNLTGFYPVTEGCEWQNDAAGVA
jgi:hypothetical protein